MIKYLEWDSVNLGMKIGCWIPKSNQLLSEFTTVVNEARKNGYKLLYLKDCELPECLLSSNVILADQKVVYSQYTNYEKKVEDECVTSILHKELTADVLFLALQSGAFSRYYTDKRMPLNVFLSLYRAWIENSLNGKIATDVLVYKYNNKVVGLLTYKQQGNIVTIGLVDIDYSIVGRGFGTKLMQFFLAKLPKGTKVDVATQHNNKQACAFYEKNGFQQIYKSNVYHIWIY